ncbi:3',5'-cyclic-nucleotide phosphodiesterase PDE1 KNAG_0I00200 [Huiozyma naganishii CBS 8797]|uniref:3',5'-cyclic-nucleotide phosphodiesterase n=1 Tax=Huiozyma naganishii (strain ATCC MYA-139 / BCRC 22969 / CBS 8797 / KCTC 17520 / NBRC 10181 / NCYC 3082 / Yp74L-3) TaxID=1071383 RepID=J7S9Z1_HUIN7|nr:hypothetical protein KNAG_0I00200 [Kazachstania naganishii CBS 8797]CCK71811.1 hypothetical protein KNAG_0I00200 [Kazachstania naganishii CBS 8797]
MFTFEVVILGGLGGPGENSSQCFMLRPYRSKGIKSICVDGGAGAAQICDTLMLQQKPVSERDQLAFHYYEPDDQQYFLENMIDKQSVAKFGFSSETLDSVSQERNALKKGYKIYQGIGEYYVTHPHLDHISAMVVNSPLVYEPPLVSEKTICGLDFTVNALQEHIFNDTIWPNLTYGKLQKLRVKTLQHSQWAPSSTFPQWEIIPFQVCHGCKVAQDSKVYSTVYLIRDKVSRDVIVICGDLEYDYEGENHKNLLDNVWRYIAKNVPFKHLKSIFIECSSSSMVACENLYGHLSPPFLIHELKSLYKFYGFTNDPFDLHVVIIHVKLTVSDTDPRKTILHELKELVRGEEGLNKVRFSIALDKHRFVL